MFYVKLYVHSLVDKLKVNTCYGICIVIENVSSFTVTKILDIIFILTNFLQ